MGYIRRILITNTVTVDEFVWDYIADVYTHRVRGMIVVCVPAVLTYFATGKRLIHAHLCTDKPRSGLRCQ